MTQTVYLSLLTNETDELICQITIADGGPSYEAIAEPEAVARIDALHDAIKKGSQHPGILDEIGRRLGQLIYAGEGGARLRQDARRADWAPSSFAPKVACRLGLWGLLEMR